jgi:hypothetical protein
MMKAMLLAVVVALALTSGVALADKQSEATAQVWVEIVANISIGVDNPVLDLGDFQTGLLDGTVTFRVDSNVETVNLYVLATSLYKGGDTTDPEVAPIPVALNVPVQVAFDNGGETEAGDNLLAWTYTGDINGVPAAQTESGEFESSQDGHFSQDVSITCTWNQADAEKTTGEYSGFVKLVGLIGEAS